MTTQQKSPDDATLALNSREDETVAEIMCAWCSGSRPIVHQLAASHVMLDWAYKEEIKAVLTCGKCGKETVFHMLGNTLSFLPGKMLATPLARNVAQNAAEMVQEGIRCFYGTSYRGVVSFCRSAVEEALDDKNVKGGNLNEKIAKAHKTAANPTGILGDEEVAQAHGARLTGRNVLHRMEQVSISQALLALTTTADLVNYIAKQPAMP